MLLVILVNYYFRIKNYQTEILKKLNFLISKITELNIEDYDKIESKLNKNNST